MVRPRLAVVIIAAGVLCACAIRRPQTWRLEDRGTGELLIPPDVRNPYLSVRTFRTDIVAVRGRCRFTDGPVALNVRHGHLWATVDRDKLASEPPAWLRTWATDVEQQGYIAPADAMKLADRVAEAVPLDPRTAMSLLYSNEFEAGELDPGAYGRLRVVSPLWRSPGVGLMADGPYQVSSEGYTLNITARSTDNLRGYETAVYSLLPNTAHGGYTILPLYADVHIGGKTERRALPENNYFRSLGGAGFYRLFYQSWRNDFTEILVGARTPAELDQRIRLLEASGTSASCQTLHNEMCVAIPKDVGVTSLIAVAVNGREILVQRGATVFNAILAAGEPHPRNVLPQLRVWKPWHDALRPVAFARSDDAILQLVLIGGEALFWR